MRRSMIHRLVLILSVIVALVFLAACPKETSNERQGPPLPTEIVDLIAILGDAHHINRSAAIEALAARGEEAVAPLTESLGKDEPTREGAMLALAKIGAPAVPALSETLKSQDRAVRDAAIRALRQIGPGAVDAVSPLKDAFTATQSPNERVLILNALADIAPDDQGLLNLLAVALNVEDLCPYALQVLGRLGPKAAGAVPNILPYLENPSTQVRMEAMDALKSIGVTEGVLTKIAERLTDPDSRIRAEAARVLGSFGSVAGPTTSALAGRIDDPEFEVRQAVISALGDIAPESRGALRQLISTLSDPNPQIRREVANALAKFGPEGESAVPDLQRAMESDEFEYVREAARRAIDSIQGAATETGSGQGSTSQAG
jgi:HEAT repeat protein